MVMWVSWMRNDAVLAVRPPRSTGACRPACARAGRAREPRTSATSAGGARPGRPRRRSCSADGLALDAPRQVLARLLAQHVPVRLERLLLGLRELLRHRHAETRQQVALAAAVQLRCAAPLDAEQLAVLRARRHLERDGPVRGWDLHGRAERRLRRRDRDLEHELGAAALVQRRRRHLHTDVEVTRRTAADAGLALALEADPRSVLGPRGH